MAKERLTYVQPHWYVVRVPLALWHYAALFHDGKSGGAGTRSRWRVGLFIADLLEGR